MIWTQPLVAGTPGGPYALGWNIASHAVPAEPFWVKEQAAIVETRLVPQGLFIAADNVSDANGRLLVPRGAQLVKVSAPVLLACTVNKQGSGISASKRVCLIDGDGDGKAEAGFVKGMGGDYWMSLEGDLLSEKVISVAPAGLTAIEPSLMTDAPYFSFHYQRILDGSLTIPLNQEGGNVVRFHFKAGREKRREWMVRECRETLLPSHCTSAAFPATLAIAGMELSVLERRKEDILVHLIKPFGGQAIKFQEIHDGYNSGSLLYAD